MSHIESRLYGESCTKRVVPTNKADDHFRSAFRRDYARLIHSPAFRRLQGKTQLYPGHESDFFRNRLTHSIEVAQIAKGITLMLNYQNSFLKDDPINCDLVEFAALAHDIGHPPFGHNGERALDDCMKTTGGFEGNAQTLRILSILEKKETSGPMFEGISEAGDDHRCGLNATYRSLASVLKYDKKIASKRPAKGKLVKGYYETEGDLVDSIRTAIAPSRKRKTGFKTVECQIMDIADDIAYSTYDLEDGLKGGFVDPLMLLATIRTNENLRSRVYKKVKRACPAATQQDVVRAVAATFSLNVDGQPTGGKTALEEYLVCKGISSDGYLRTALTSTLVDRFIRGVRIKIDEKYPALSTVYLEPDTKVHVETLKHLNYEVTIMSPRLKLVEYRGYEIIKTIYKALVRDKGFLLMPQDFRESYLRLKKRSEKYRVVCDFVAGMTDRYAIEFFGRLKQGDQSIFKPF